MFWHQTRTHHKAACLKCLASDLTRLVRSTIFLNCRIFQVVRFVNASGTMTTTQETGKHKADHWCIGTMWKNWSKAMQSLYKLPRPRRGQTPPLGTPLDKQGSLFLNRICFQLLCSPPFIVCMVILHCHEPKSQLWTLMTMWAKVFTEPGTWKIGNSAPKRWFT